MPADWLSSSSEVSGRVGAALSGALQSLSEPARARRLRQILILLLALWAVLALSRLVWAFIPQGSLANTPSPDVINPVVQSAIGPQGEDIDVEKMRSWHLFGEAGAAAQVAVEAKAAAPSAREGIEDGARQTRLQLTLRGIVSSSEDGLGHAIIEFKSRQNVYAVEDKLPVPGRVSLAKVMREQVVLDNGGTYELLRLFDKSKIGSVASAPAPRTAPPAVAVVKQVDKRSDAETTALAVSYREKLYSNPQSLASVVSVSAVREGGELRGYRVRPGSDSEQFAQLGFEAGDMVTSVNGIELNNPANTMVLYNAMRSAGEVVFELQRKDQPISISVSLAGGAP